MFPRFVALFFALVSFAAAQPPAQPAGLPNFHKVDEHVYRGAQPTPEGFHNLSVLGIRTVVDLRGSEHSEAAEKKIVEADGMRYVGIPMRGMSTPTDKQISDALRLMNDPASAPVFIHCRRGADRTGAVIACYRISHDHWDTAKAQDEANSLGMSFFQLAIRRYVAHYGGKPGGEIAIPATVLQPR
jgi:protein tyrosine/serine phosphatase